MCTSQTSFKIKCKHLQLTDYSDNDIVLLDKACKPLKPNPLRRVFKNIPDRTIESMLVKSS